jgi:DNA-binding CsgD family transcriptional regulator
MARGASARQAAGKLGIKQDTVQKHIVEAKARAGVRSMSQLVVRSLFDGAVTFNDLLDGKPN